MPMRQLGRDLASLFSNLLIISRERKNNLNYLPNVNYETSSLIRFDQRFARESSRMGKLISYKQERMLFQQWPSKRHIPCLREIAVIRDLGSQKTRRESPLKRSRERPAISKRVLALIDLDQEEVTLIKPQYKGNIKGLINQGLNVLNVKSLAITLINALR